jgi:DNA-binding NtrC family response regulator
MLALQPPDVIVLDVVMHHHTGLDLLHKCHDLQVPVVVVTAGTWKAPAALQGSVVVELMKPVARKGFVDVVTMATERGAVERELQGLRRGDTTTKARLGPRPQPAAKRRSAHRTSSA